MKKVSIRRRVVISSIVSTILFFFLTTPFSDFVFDLFKSPSPVREIEVLRTITFVSDEAAEPKDELKIKWGSLVDSDLSKLEIFVNGQKYIDSNGNQNFIESNSLDLADISRTEDVELRFNIIDVLGDTTSTNVEVTSLISTTDGTSLNSKVINENMDVQPKSIIQKITEHSGILLPFILVCSLWIFQFSVRNIKSFAILFYPASIVIPYIFIALSFLYSSSSGFASYLASLIFSFGFFALIYLLFLTTNILNASIYNDLPLEQAAKAAQFVFSLLAFYLILILFFGSNITVLQKMVLFLPFVFYFSFSSIVMLKGVVSSPTIVMVKSVSITLTMGLTIIVLSLWPIDYIFAMLSAAVIYYVILSLALEVRVRIAQNIWVEYIVLMLLIVLLIMLNSSWGILGGII